ncbi:MAG: hypothetical protein MZV64_01690 [Ignavibacteriales bacterium]|nr:hypothetical protein [Ignavibacteriales bacterium]
MLPGEPGPYRSSRACGFSGACPVFQPEGGFHAKINQFVEDGILPSVREASAAHAAKLR